MELILKITDRGFMWQSPQGTRQLAQELFAPLKCRGEELKIIHHGDVVDKATIETIGTHGSYEGFNGLTQLLGSQYHQSLKFEPFRNFDEVRVSGIPLNFSELDYWRELTLDKAVDLPQEIDIGDLIVGEQFMYANSTYEVKQIDRDGHQWPAPRWYHIGPAGNQGIECRLPYDRKVIPLVPVTVTNGVMKLGDRVLAGQ